MQPDTIKELPKSIRKRCRCKSRYVESVRVTEMFRDKEAWVGHVAVFDLIGHRRAKRAYAWNYRERKTTETVVVLEIPPVNSPQTAVKIAIAATAKRTK